MGHMVALSAGGGHDGGIRDRGAVVPEHGAGKAGGDADNEQGAVGGENIGDDGDENAEGAPACAGGEAEQTGHKEDDGGKKAEKSPGGAVHKGGYKVLCPQKPGHVLEGGGKGENDDGGNHVVEALGNALHGILEADKLFCTRSRSE